MGSFTQLPKCSRLRSGMMCSQERFPWPPGIPGTFPTSSPLTYSAWSFPSGESYYRKVWCPQERVRISIRTRIPHWANPSVLWSVWVHLLASLLDLCLVTGSTLEWFWFDLVGWSFTSLHLDFLTCIIWVRGGHGNPLQYFCLENPMDRGAWWATVPGVAKGRTRLSD